VSFDLREAEFHNENWTQRETVICQLQKHFPIFFSLQVDHTCLLTFVTHIEPQTFDVFCYQRNLRLNLHQSWKVVLQLHVLVDSTCAFQQLLHSYFLLFRVQQHACDHRIQSHGRVALLSFIKLLGQLKWCIIHFFYLDWWVANLFKIRFEDYWLQIPNVDVTKLVTLHLNKFLNNFF